RPLESAGHGGAAHPTVSPAHRVGLRWRVLHLLGRGRLARHRRRRSRSLVPTGLLWPDLAHVVGAAAGWVAPTLAGGFAHADCDGLGRVHRPRDRAAGPRLPLRAVRPAAVPGLTLWQTLN